MGKGSYNDQVGRIEKLKEDEQKMELTPLGKEIVASIAVVILLAVVTTAIVTYYWYIYPNKLVPALLLFIVWTNVVYPFVPEWFGVMKTLFKIGVTVCNAALLLTVVDTVFQETFNLMVFFISIAPPALSWLLTLNLVTMGHDD